MKYFDIIIRYPEVSPISYSYNYIYKTINGTYRDTYCVSIQIWYDTYRLLLKVYNPSSITEKSVRTYFKNITITPGQLTVMFEFLVVPMIWQLIIYICTHIYADIRHYVMP